MGIPAVPVGAPSALTTYCVDTGYVVTADGAAASSIKQLEVSRALAEGTGDSICTGARSGFLPFSGYDSDDVLTNTMNLAGVGSAAPDFSHFYGFPLDGYVYSDLLQGSGSDNIIGIPPSGGALGRSLAQPFSFLGSLIKYGSALPRLRRRRRRWRDCFSCSPPTIAAFTFIAVDFC